MCVYVLVSERFDDMLDVHVVYNIYRVPSWQNLQFIISHSLMKTELCVDQQTLKKFFKKILVLHDSQFAT